MEDARWFTDKKIVFKIGNNIRRFRLELNMTRKELSERSGISITTIDKLERGLNFNIITLVRCLRILDRLDVLNDLLADRELTPYELRDIESGYKPRLRASHRKQ